MEGLECRRYGLHPDMLTRGQHRQGPHAPKKIKEPVRMEGLEPPYLAASDPKSDVSTNFTTSGKTSQ
jgi:hypothetical protein